MLLFLNMQVLLVMLSRSNYFLDGVPLVLADTAGIRSTDDFVEKIGVEKSRQLLQTAELVICVIDGSAGLTEEDEAILEAAR